MRLNEYHIEQRVGRAVLPPLRIDEGDDRFIRARDGYAFVMAIKAGTHTYCRKCHLRCEVPVLRTSEIKCEYCERVKARRGREFGGYWPLNDRLLQYLHKIDPNRDGHLNGVAEGDLAMERAEMARQRSIHNHIESATLDDKYQLFGTPFSGYTGKSLGTPDINGKPL